MKRTKTILTFQKCPKKLITSQDITKLLSIKNDNTLHKTTGRLVDAGVLTRLCKGKYLLSTAMPDEFQIANFLYAPSYISLESALNFYGILIQTPYQITSITPLRTKGLFVENREYIYNHITPRFYHGYERQNNILIATPEKALADTLYFMSKGLGRVDLAELDLKGVKKSRLFKTAGEFQYRPLSKLLKRIKNDYF